MEPKIYLLKDHGIPRDRIDPDALYVLSRLQDAGYTAYLVGGGVRDLLAGRIPKDFDISTSALPEDIKQIFGRRCILIGRRFRLAHVRFGHHVVEVSTFRAGDPEEGALITRDNEWGTPEEDVLRRDFTINGLFYDPTHETVIDYVGGWEDLKKGQLVTIGDPTVRFQQDPVRMIRLLKFQARFDLSIEPKSLKALKQSKELITMSAPARILEEMLRMLESGFSAPFFTLMIKHQLLGLLFPSLASFLDGEHGSLIFDYLKSADQLHLDQSPVTLGRSILIACLLYPILEREISKQFLDQGKTPHLGEITLLSSSLIKEMVVSSFSHFPKRITAAAQHIMVDQYRITPLTHRRGSRKRIMSGKEFAMSLRFFRVRSVVHPPLKPLYESWLKEFREVEHHGEGRPYPAQTPVKKRRRPRRKRKVPHDS